MRKLFVLFVLSVFPLWAGAQEDFNALETPLTFEAVDGTVRVGIRNFFSSNQPTIQYRIDDGDWTDFKVTMTECEVGDPYNANWIPAGKIVQIRSNEWPPMIMFDLDRIGDGLAIYCSSDCYVYGNIMSLETYDYATNYDIPATFGCLFLDNTHIKNHPTKALVLPSKTLSKSCYTAMFKGCTGLTVAPDLPATELPEYDTFFDKGCYESMFEGCTGLTAAPALPAKVLTKGCYSNMFNGCTNLKAVTCDATDISAEYATKNWLNGVSTTGIFKKPASVTDWQIGVSGIPVGWNIETSNLRGDLNYDGVVDTADLVILVNIILGRE